MFRAWAWFCRFLRRRAALAGGIEEMLGGLVLRSSVFHRCGAVFKRAANRTNHIMPKSQSSRLFLAAALLVGTWLLWFLAAPKPPAGGASPAVATPAQKAASVAGGGNPAEVSHLNTPAAAPAPVQVAPAVPAVAALPELPNLPANRAQISDVLDRLQLTLRDFRTANGGNPVGTNAEITRALLGDNLKQTKHDIPEGTRLNGAGELCDPWGTPYFFHQQSAVKMEIRSAGPDHKMWTADDVQL